MSFLNNDEQIFLKMSKEFVFIERYSQPFHSTSSTVLKRITRQSQEVQHQVLHMYLLQVLLLRICTTETVSFLLQS